MKIKLNAMPKSRKGILFTFIAIVLSALVITMFFALTEPALDESVASTQIRVRQSTLFISQIEDYASYQLSATTYSAIHQIEKEMEVAGGRGLYYSQPEFFDQALTACALSGTHIGPPGGAVGAESQCPGLKQKLDELSGFASTNLGINTTIIVESYKFYQTSPWFVELEANISINATDNYAQWNITHKTIKSSMPIFGLRDPTHTVSLHPSVNSLYQQKVFETKDEPGLLFEHPSTINNLYPDGYYYYTSEAPSFLNRMRGDHASFSACCGIISMLNHSDVEAIANWEEHGHADFMILRQIPCRNLERFNFWASGMTPGERALLGINETGGYLNETIIPTGAAADMNMSGPYLDDVTRC